LADEARSPQLSGVGRFTPAQVPEKLKERKLRTGRSDVYQTLKVRYENCTGDRKHDIHDHPRRHGHSDVPGSEQHIGPGPDTPAPRKDRGPARPPLRRVLPA
jgi:hypothetical protein